MLRVQGLGFRAKLLGQRVGVEGHVRLVREGREDGIALTMSLQLLLQLCPGTKRSLQKSPQAFAVKLRAASADPKP